MSLTLAQEELVDGLRLSGLAVSTETGSIRIIPSTDHIYAAKAMRHVRHYTRTTETDGVWSPTLGVEMARASCKLTPTQFAQLAGSIERVHNTLRIDNLAFPHEAENMASRMQLIGECAAIVEMPWAYTHCAACMTLFLSLLNPVAQIHRWGGTYALSVLLNGHEGSM